MDQLLGLDAPFDQRLLFVKHCVPSIVLGESLHEIDDSARRTLLMAGVQAGLRFGVSMDDAVRLTGPEGFVLSIRAKLPK